MTSQRSYVSSTAPQETEPEPPKPEFFIDQSLGQKKLRRAIEDRGYVAHTVNEWFKLAPMQRLPGGEPRWIRLAGERGFLILTKDDVRIPQEQGRDVEESAARVFWLTERQLKSREQIAWYMFNLDDIVKHGAKPGPFMYGVYADHVSLLQLRPPPPVAPGEQTSMLE